MPDRKERWLQCRGCGTVYRHIHKYSDCDNAGCEGEESDEVPSPTELLEQYERLRDYVQSQADIRCLVRTSGIAGKVDCKQMKAKCPCGTCVARALIADCPPLKE